MTGRPWYAFYPDAYERDTSHLSLMQEGAYRRLLDHYYKTENALPVDPVSLYRMCRVSTQAERAALNSVLAEFFYLGSDGRYHNKRADEEIQKAVEISAKRSDAANKRHSKTYANAEQKHTHSTTTSTATSSEAKASSGLEGAPQAASKPRRKAKTSIPENVPSPEARENAVQFWGAHARVDLIPQLQDQIDQFKDHHLKLGSAFADWDAAWRNWYRNALKFTPKANQNGNGTGKLSAHDKGSLGAAIAIALSEGREPPRVGDGAGKALDCLSPDGHGSAQVGDPVSDLHRRFGT